MYVAQLLEGRRALGRQALSKGEMEAARALWSLGSGTVREVHGKLASQRDIEFGTVQTYLRRLESKGYVKSKLANHRRIYTARIEPDRVIRETVDDMVGRLFGGRTMPLVRHLVERNEMSRTDIEELRQLVDRLEVVHADV
jgi:predicted transcriptional regulator